MSKSSLTYQEIAAQKFAKYQEQKEKEEKEKNLANEKIRLEQEEKLRLENEKIRLEQEEKLMKEMLYHEKFYNFVDQIENITTDIRNAKNIIEIDFIVNLLISLLENNKHFIDDENNDYLKQEITAKIIAVINEINQNENSQFDVTIKNDNYLASRRIVENTKIIIQMIKYDDDEINIELMDTIRDDKIAQEIHDEETELNRIISDNIARKIYEEETRL